LPAGPNQPTFGGSPSGVWTGKHVVIWGTESGGGWLYEPQEDRWIGMTIAPPGFAPRFNYSTTWTGKELIVWAGLRGDPALEVDDGAAYAP
jgi:hypothetical protein